MPFNASDLDAFKADLDSRILAIQKLKTDSHATIKIQSLLNIVAYISATRFLEGVVKHIIYNCCKIRGDSEADLNKLISELKAFNNPEFSNIVDVFSNKLNFNILDGKINGKYIDTDISFLNEIVRNRHRNAHAHPDSSEWYNKNLKDLNDFNKEYKGLIKIVEYLDSIFYDISTSKFSD